MPPAGFERTIPAKERPQTHALDRAATGIGMYEYYWCQVQDLGTPGKTCDIKTRFEKKQAI